VLNYTLRGDLMSKLTPSHTHWDDGQASSTL
jgi:hypothetical protein